MNMMKRLLRTSRNACRAKLAGKRGMSLGEVLITVLIVLLMTSALVTGASFANRQYHASMKESEAKILYSTLSSVIHGELSNTRTIKLGEKVAGSADVYELESFFSRTYANRKDFSSFISVRVGESQEIYPTSDRDGYGELFLGTMSADGLVGNLLVSSASYSFYHLSAKVDVKYDRSSQIFIVDLSVRDGSNEKTSGTFEVLPLNSISEE